MAERQRLTDTIVRRLPPPEQGKQIPPDRQMPGFGIRVTANGARSYVLRYTTRAGRERTYTIGDATVWRTTDACDKARELRREIEDGGDPLGEIEDERAAPTMLDLIERFRTEHLPRKRPSTRDDYERTLRLHIGPHFGSITRWRMPTSRTSAASTASSPPPVVRIKRTGPSPCCPKCSTWPSVGVCASPIHAWGSRRTPNTIGGDILTVTSWCG